jgi:ABC-type glycerol-3-phosphate transport system substrate-binding protein
MTQLGLLFPSRKSVAESDTFLKTPPPTNNQVYLDEVQYAKILPMHPAYPEMEKAVGDEVALVLAGSKSVADAVTAMNGKVNALLKG